MNKFKTFRPGITTFAGGRIAVSATENLNEWLEEHPGGRNPKLADMSYRNHQ